MASSLPRLIPALAPAAWLVPNHYPPWVSAWNEALALCVVAVSLCLVGKQRARLPAKWGFFIAACLCVIAVQTASGVVLFTGDAVMAALYLCAFGGAIVVGSTLPAADRTDGLSLLAVCTLTCAMVSVFIALSQWTGAVSWGIWQVDMPPGGRPFGNVAQPNHFCTIAFLGIVAAGLLRQTGQLSALGFYTCAVLLILGTVCSASRTGWLQIGALVLFLIGFGPQRSSRSRALPAVVLGAAFTVLTVLWPSINEALMLRPGRWLQESIQPGTRFQHWGAMLEALRQDPWGYGWQQVSVAQTAVAADRPHVGENIEHAHNVVLDLLIWNGVAIGGALVALGVAALLPMVRRCRTERGVWLVIALIGCLLHALLEYPLEYAYFLIPCGFFVGAFATLEQLEDGWVIPQSVVRFGGVAIAIVLLVVGRDYIALEQSFRILRFEAAKIGTKRIESATPDVAALTQQSALQRFARMEARPGMSAAELAFMSAVARRFPYPPMLFRYALAAGLNGRAEEASLTIRLLCRIHPYERCVEAYAAWDVLLVQHPSLSLVRMEPTPLAATGLDEIPPPSPSR
jgi:hypothetical protein